MIPWIILAIVVAGITAYSLLRKGLAGLPLALGTWGLFFTGAAAVAWFPPTTGKLLVLAFTAGVSIALIAWGLANVIANKLALKPFYGELEFGDKFYIRATKTAKSPYGVLYGFLPWNAEGAGYFVDFLKKQIWGRGYKLTFLQVEHIEIAGTSVAAIWGVIQPKTIIDRILY